MKRREFLEQSCLACGAAIIGTGFLTLESCATAKNAISASYENGYLIVSSEIFKEQNTQVIKSSDYSDNVFVIKKNDRYKAFKMKCTHKGAGLKVEGNELKCPLHGSRFTTTEGKVINGPAKNDLQSFPVEVSGNTIRIKVT